MISCARPAQPLALGGSRLQRQRCQRPRALRVLAGELSGEDLQKALDRQVKKSAKKKDLSSDQQQKALDRQLKKSAAKSAESDLAQRQREARAWITPWLEQQAKKKSREAQIELRERVSMISTDAEQQALKRLLFGGSMDEAAEEEAAPAPAAAAAAAPAAPAAAPAEEKSRLAPHTYEDGSLLFTAELLQAVSYEDVLTA